MRFKVLIAFLVVAGLAGLTYYLSLEQPVEPDAGQPEPAIELLRVDMDKLALIRIERDGLLIELAPAAEDQWRLTSPVAAPADATQVRSLISSLRYMGQPERVQEPGGDLATFGLAQGAIKLTLSDGRLEQSLSFGGAAPLGRGTYALDPQDNAVYLVPPGIERYLGLGPDELRDRRVFAMAAADLIELSVEQRGRRGRTLLSKRDGTWRLAEPFPALAEANALISLANKVERLQVEQYLDQEQAERRRRELRLPALRIGAVSRAGEPAEENTRVLLLGPERDGVRLAQLEGADELFTLSAEYLNDFITEPATLADRRLLSIDPQTAQRIDLQLGSDSITLTRSEQGFDVASGEARIDATKVSALLERLRQAFWDEPRGPAATPREVRRAGLDRLLLKVVLYDADGRTLAGVTLGSEGRGRTNAAMGDPAYAYRLRTETLEGLGLPSTMLDLAPAEQTPEPAEEEETDGKDHG